MLSAAWFSKDPYLAWGALVAFILVALMIYAGSWIQGRDRPRQVREREQLAALIKIHPPIGYIRKCFLSLDVTLIFLFVTNCLLVTIFSSTLTLAFTADAFQNYELAERIFSLVPWPNKGDYSLAAFRAYYVNNTEENHSVDERLNAVAAVYGSASSQMAHLLFMEGERCRSEGSGRSCTSAKEQLTIVQSMMDQILEAEQWYQKSLSLNEQLCSYAACVDDLGGIVSCQLKRGDVDGAELSLNRALDLIKNHSEIKPTADTFDTLAWACALSPGQKKLSASLFRSSQIAEQTASKESDREAAGWLLSVLRWITLGLLIKLIADAFAFTIRVIQLRHLSQEWSRQAGSNDFQARVDALSSLTTLELYKRKYQKADAYSQQLLKLCETAIFRN